MEEGSNAFKILRGKTTGQTPLGRPTHRGKDNIRINLKEIDAKTRKWIDLAQDKDYRRYFVNSALNLRVS